MINAAAEAVRFLPQPCPVFPPRRSEPVCVCVSEQEQPAAAAAATAQGPAVIYMGQVQEYAEWYTDESAIPEAYRDMFELCRCGTYWERDGLQYSNSEGEWLCQDCYDSDSE